MDHFLVAPYLIPLEVSERGSQFSGYLNILGKSYRVLVSVPHDKGLQAARLECEWKLHYRLQHKTDLITQRLQSAHNLTSFLRDFIVIAKSCLKIAEPGPGLWTSGSREILQQVKEIGWKSLINISENFSCVELGLYDTAGRWHTLKIKLNQEGGTPPLCVTDLPEKFDFHWSPKSRLKHVYQQFETAVGSYQEFWNMMRELDEHCWILEPEHPTFASVHRRVALGPNISLHLTVNFRQPAAFPECRLLGAESAVASLREKLNVNLHRWDVERSLLKNLQEVLDMDFPTPADTKKEELSLDCGICYCHHMNEEIPDIICEDKRCAQAFHYTCLYEWLRNLSSRQSFNTLFGECPFCSHPIRVKMPSG